MTTIRETWRSLDFRLQTALTLALVAFVSLRITPTARGFSHIVLSVLLALAFEFTFSRLNKAVASSFSALVTGLLIGLILDPSATMFQWLFVLFAAFFNKYWLRLFGRHIFNPAALGLIVGSVLFHAPISWWGVSSSVWVVPVLLIGMYLVLKRMRLLKLPLGFLLLYGGYLLTRFMPTQLVVRLFDPTVILFAVVMTAEPKTSPISYPWRNWFGVLVAAMAIVFLEAIPVLTIDPFLLGLLTADALGYLAITLPVIKK